MSLYQTGTVNMTNNSAAVVGVGTAFVANVTAGDGFLISGETVYYTVLSITDDTHLTLSVVYAGITGNGKTYQISRDWTTNLGLAEIQPGDPNWPYLLVQKVIRKLDTWIGSAAGVTNTPAGNIAATNVQAAINELDTEKAALASPTLITPKSTTTIGVGNATPAASGAGITFPATQSASSDANTLDDYEEGTWTVSLTPTSGTISIVAAMLLGRYTKIGDVVHLTAWLTVETISSPTGVLTIGGFPFTAGNNNGNMCAASVIGTGLAAGATTSIVARVIKNTATGIIHKYAAGNLADLAGDVQGASATDFYFTAIYKTN